MIDSNGMSNYLGLCLELRKSGSYLHFLCSCLRDFFTLSKWDLQIKTFYKLLYNKYKTFHMNQTNENYKCLNRYIWPIDRTLSGTAIFAQREPESNGNKGLLHTLHRFRTGASPSNAVYCHTQDTSSIWPIDRTLTGTTTLDQSGTESNGNTLLIASELEIYHQIIFEMGGK